MKRIFTLLILLCCFVTISEAQYRKGYYDKMNGKQKAELKAAAKACVQSHTTLVYTDLPNYWQYSDVYPALVDGQKRWWDMYSAEIFLIKSNQTARSSFSANGMNREHSVPKSWWSKSGDVEYTPAYSDMWNLYPSDGPANMAKSNYPLGLCQTASFNNGVSKIGTAKSGYGGGAQKVFEPADEYKGDFARAYFYVATVYDDINWVINYMFSQEAYPTLVPWAKQMLLEWARQDPVSQKEIDRNNSVEIYQGNRNPFVDFPDLVEYIWGTKTGETFYVNGGSDPEPPITGDPEITLPVNGEALDFGQTAIGQTVKRSLKIEAKNLTAPLEVRVVGANKSLFAPLTPEPNAIPAATINRTGNYLMEINYSPAEVGNHTAKITLTGGGMPDGFSLVVNLIGEAKPVPEFVTLTANQPTDVTATSYTASWSAVPVGKVADFYLVTRTRVVDGQTEVETYETQETSMRFTDRVANGQETYYVQYSCLGMLSPVSNAVVVSGSSVDELQGSAPVAIYPIDGGFMVGVVDDVATLRVCNLNGVEVVNRSDVRDGECFLLPRGVYVVWSSGAKPQKLMVK